MVHIQGKLGIENMNEKNLIIAVAGGSGSGKTFFANALHKRLGSSLSTIIYQDNYYRDQSHKFDRDGGAVNFDHPDSLDFELLRRDLAFLQNNRPIEMPCYDFKTHARLPKTQVVAPKKIIIVDGILILSSPELDSSFDLSIFVETPESIRYERRLTRDVTERGRTPQGVDAQFQAQVKPMHDKFVEPSKWKADYISSGTDMRVFREFLEAVDSKLIQGNPLPIERFRSQFAIF